MRARRDVSPGAIFTTLERLGRAWHPASQAERVDSIETLRAE
jgi:hypothetical protein